MAFSFDNTENYGSILDLINSHFELMTMSSYIHVTLYNSMSVYILSALMALNANQPKEQQQFRVDTKKMVDESRMRWAKHCTKSEHFLPIIIILSLFVLENNNNNE